MPYVIRTRDLDLDCTHTWQRPHAPKWLANSFWCITTAHSVYNTLKGATRQRDKLKQLERYASYNITVDEI
jgi:hypothetical protein